MKKKIIRLSLSLVVVAVAYGAWLLWCASQKLVTLDVRDMDVREVVKKIERQTWETILADSNVTGKVTIKVKRAHIETVLDIITDQISARWSSFYPLYSSGQSFGAFKKSVRGELDPAANGWTNLQARGSFGGGPGGFGGRGGGGGPGGGGPGGGGGILGDSKDPNLRISLNISGKDVQFATLALNRFAQARVVPEDGTTGLVSLPLDQVKVSDAVARLAKQVHRKWARIYSLQGFPDFGRGGDLARGNGRGDRTDDGGGGRRSDWMNMTDEERDQRRQERENVEKELTQVLPAAEQAKIAEEKEKRDQARQEMANMTDEQRREHFQQLAASGQGGRFGGGGNRDARMLDRIKNTTPEQKVDRYRTAIERRARWDSRGGGQGGPGGPGRGR